MPAPFTRSMRSLAADGFGRSILGLLLVVGLLGAWIAWFCLARVTLYEVTELGRLEVGGASYPVAASVAGRVVVTRMSLGLEVHEGQVLVELDARAQTLQMEEERARLAALSPQMTALRGEIAAEEKAFEAARQETLAALVAARVRRDGAEAAAKFGEEQAERWARLYGKFLVAELEFLRAKDEARARRTVADVLRIEVDRLESEKRAREKTHQARLAQLHRELELLKGQVATASATIARLEEEIEKRRIWAPVGGRVAEVANLRTGAMVSAGEKVASVVPAGDIRGIAYFLPSALGRVRPGQPARLRLHGFPWVQYGSIPATVTSVASEVRDGQVRVELLVHQNPASRIPFQHGLPGSVEVETERAVPATLVLRTAGRFLARLTTAPESPNEVRVQQ